MTLLSDIDFGINSASGLPQALKQFSETCLAELAPLAVPTRKTEAWKYSAKYLKLTDNIPATTAISADYQASYELDCHTILVSHNSAPSFDAQALSAQGIELKLFSSLNEQECELVSTATSNSSEQLVFAKLNSALMQDGIFINVPKNTQLQKPLKIVFLSNASGLSLPRVFVNLEANTEATLIEEFVIQAEGNTGLVNNVCDLRVGENARLNYLRMNIESAPSKHIGLTAVALHRNARFNSHCLALGSQLARHDLHVQMLEPGAECDLNGVCVTTDSQHYDNHTCIEHIAPHCISNENYRCIADNKSHIVFNGRIHIHPDAQKTLGSMSNKNLLLSSEAAIDSKPELEIYADDVKCAHGTTIGQLDETELYYLKTRGVTHEQARLMLTLGFVLEVVRAAPIETIAEFWEQKLAELLSYPLD
jgi:Fe-S cluster assembly protein SufD